MKQVWFKNRNIDIAGHLHLPPDFDETGTYAALVVATPGSSVKEQIGGIYASRMAENGFIALTFDPSYQGESEGEPRDLEDAAARAEDIRAAVDFLTTQRFVDENRIGLLGISAGGGYGIHAALTEHRLKAIGTVVANDIGTSFRQFQPTREALLETIAAIGRARTAHARGEAARRDPWIPDSLEDARAQGITEPDLLEAISFYRESAYRHPRSTNRILFSSFGSILSFDAFHLVPELLTQPLQVIVGGRRGPSRQYEGGERLFNLSRAKEKDFFVVEGAGHYDMYYKPEYVGQAVDRLVPFYRKHLGG